MDGHTFLAAEPSHMEDGVPLHNHLAHHLREARTPPLTRPSSQHPIYSTAGPSYAEYPIHSYDSSLPTPVSGAGSPGSPEGTPEMHTIKHEPSSGIRNSPPLSSQAEWPYASTVTYPSHPHSPAALQNPHGFPSYDGLDTPDDSDNQHPGPTEAPFWPSPAMTTESIPYPMMVDMAQGGHNLHAPHHPQQNHHHHHHQSHDIYEQGHFHDSGSSVNMRGSTHPYPPFAHSQPGMVLEMNTATVGHSTPRPPRNRVSRTPKKSPGARRSRTKRPKARPRDEADDKSERYPKDPAERIKFDDDMKEQDRFLYNLRCELGSRNGEDMWDLIVRQYGEKYSPKQKACLQMQLKRAVTKHQARNVPSSSSRLTAR
ncbi:hypothetical protein Micbo1qcDRAFT_64414 [Microdochium bolleyi]|uniref:Uncharacterized protein n=1 Tax=Microdochium bolleyi TaxID=196109 RepID=A0A136J2D5_9PEZI|nr:hypothetical protein Micbo1qcDRAFT_64414 [Microdochium bolleyi]